MDGVTRSGQTDVLIVGGGPVGLGLAADLGRRGIRAVLVEKGDGTIFHPRANTVNSRTMEFCRRWGIAEQVRRSGAPPDFPPDILYLTGLQGYLLAKIPRPTHGGHQPLPHTPERSQRCNQLFFDPILRGLAQGFPSVDLRYDTVFEDFAQDDAGVTASLRDAEGAYTLRAQYLVAACGGGSVVRDRLAVRMDGIQVLSYHLNLFLRIPQLWTWHDKGKAAFYMFVTQARREANLVELNGDDLWRMSLDFGPDRKPAADIDPAALVRRFVGADVPYEVISVLPWTCRSIVADKWRQGRVMLAGDAVHQHGPAGGFGMNTGMGDAVDLGWKLAALVQGWGGPALLDGYQAERRPVAQRNVTEATENMMLLTDTQDLDGLEQDSPAGAALRQRVGDEILRNKTKQYVSDGIALGYRYEASPIVVPDGTEAPPYTSMEYRQTSRPGARAPHGFLADGRSTLDLFGDGFVLLDFGGDATKLLAAARQRDVPLSVAPIAEPEIAALYERRLVLVRPDGHVAWRGDAPPADALGLIDRVRGAGPASEGRKYA
jgi:2-polyprenyl-6-methoxyphenol hydroxylase-like FAD-dependent oxidoreductase